MISITRRTLGVLVIKPAKGGAQLTVNTSGNPAQIKVRLDIARQGPPGVLTVADIPSDPLAYYILAKN